MKKITSFAAYALTCACAIAAAPLSGMADELITQRPSGELNDKLVWNSSSFYEYQGSAFEETVNERAVQVVVDGSDFYLYNPFTKFATGTWLKGTIDEDGNVTIPTPQLIYKEESLGRVYQYYVNRLIPGEAPDDYTIVYELDQEELGIHFVYRNGTLMQTDAENVMMGLTSAGGEWAFYGEKDIICDPLTISPVAPENPSELDLSLFSLQYHLQDVPAAGKVVQMAIDGDTMWIHDFTDRVNDCWIKGNINGDKVTFPSGQFLGAGEGFYQYFIAGKSVKAFSEILNRYYYNHEEGEEIVFTLQEDGSWASAEDATIFVNIGNNGLERGSMEAMQNPVFKPYQTVEAAPKNPVITDFSQYKASEYCGYVRFQLAPESANGAFLNPNDIYYQIFFNDGTTPQTFTTEDYAYLPVPSITSIPYFFNDGTMIYKNGDLITFVFYPSNLTSIGIMAYSDFGNGNIKVSDISWVNLNNGNRYTSAGVIPDNSGVDGIDVENDTVEAYYDLNGRRVLNPANGLYIAKMKSGKTHKVMRYGK